MEFTWCLLTVCLMGVYGKTAYIRSSQQIKQDPLGGPNVCFPESESPCCEGWTQSRHGPCVKPLCKPPCRRGVCVGPNMCLCHGGIRAAHCPHLGRFVDRSQHMQRGCLGRTSGCGLMDVLQTRHSNCPDAMCSSNGCTGRGCQLGQSQDTVTNNEMHSENGYLVNGYLSTDTGKPLGRDTNRRSFPQGLNHNQARPSFGQRHRLSSTNIDFMTAKKLSLSDDSQTIHLPNDQSSQPYHLFKGRGTETHSLGSMTNNYHEKTTTQEHSRRISSSGNVHGYIRANINKAHHGINQHELTPIQNKRRPASLLMNPYDERSIHNYIRVGIKASNSDKLLQSRSATPGQQTYKRQHHGIHRLSHDQPRDYLSFNKNHLSRKDGQVRHRFNRRYGTNMCKSGRCYHNEKPTTDIHNTNPQKQLCIGRRCTLQHRLNEIQNSPCRGSSCQSKITEGMNKPINTRRACVLPFCDIRNPFYDQRSIVSTSSDCSNCNSGNCVGGVCVQVVCASGSCTQTKVPSVAPNDRCKSGMCTENTVIIDEPCKDDEVFVEDENGFRTCQNMDEFLEKMVG